jgi:hypothetical protein
VSFSVTAIPARTGFEQPSPAELKRIAEIVFKEHPALKAPDAEFARAFRVVGGYYRRPKPDSGRWFSFWIDMSNERLRQQGEASVSGSALLAAIIGMNDIVWHAMDREIGQSLEVGINPYGGLPCTNAWRLLLQGQPLRPPLPSPSAIPRGPIKVIRGELR